MTHRMEQIYHNSRFCSRNMHSFAYMFYKMVQYGIWDWYISGFVRLVYCARRISVRSWRHKRHSTPGPQGRAVLFCVFVGDFKNKWKRYEGFLLSIVISLEQGLLEKIQITTCQHSAFDWHIMHSHFSADVHPWIVVDSNIGRVVDNGDVLRPPWWEYSAVYAHGFTGFYFIAVI